MAAGAIPAPSDEEMRKLLKPAPSADEVVSALRSSHGRTFTVVKELESYDDVNYLVTDGESGTKYLAKVHNGVESLDYHARHAERSSVIDLQNAVFHHLGGPSCPDITTSAPVPATDGEPVSVHPLPVVSEAHSPCRLVVRLLTWVEGVTMSDFPGTQSQEDLADAGQYLGNLRRRMDELAERRPETVTAATRYHAWDGQNTLDLSGFVDCIDDEGRRAMVLEVLDAFRAAFGENGKGEVAASLPRGILQGDFNDANIIVRDGKVAGVIDFGDCVHSWRVLDISVAMAYAMLTTLGKAGRSLSAMAAVLRGFNSVYPLTELERKHLRLLVACRLCQSVTLGAYSYKQNPENEYLLLHAVPGWNSLALLWGRGSGGGAIAEAIDRLIDLACSRTGTDCSDIAFPDPDVPDVFKAVRAMVDGNDAGRPAKKRKVDSAASTAITFVTGNKKKLEEVKRILSANGDLPFTIMNHKLDLPELQGDTISIAEEKCTLAAKEISGPVITEDTSLCFRALNDLPGPYIKWFLEKCGHKGLNDMIAFSDDKSAYAQTVVAFCPGPGKPVVTFDGRTEGKIVLPRGSLDFGWDPIFNPDEGDGLTYAEMTKKGKDAISHRQRAFSQLRAYFKEQEESIKKSIA